MNALLLVARILAVGSILLQVFASSVTVLSPVASPAVIVQAVANAQGPSRPLPKHAEHSDADCESDDAPDPMTAEPIRLQGRADPRGAPVAAAVLGSKRRAIRWAIERPPRPASA
ncbi:MAG: hypothetical protein OXR73_08065 [Myxococcales bacterium]|nr:hypothetical protein [Myxococcales bacterium]